MSRLEKGWWIARIAASLLVVYLLRSYSPTWGMVVGGVVTFVIFPYVLEGLAALEILLIGKPRGKPLCPYDCSSNPLDYEFLYSKGKALVFQCKCGKRYIDYKDRFMRLEPDGMAIPYMKYINRRKGWVPDLGPAINFKELAE